MSTKKKAPTLQELTVSIGKWQKRTFPTTTLASAAEHLRRESHEILDQVAMHDPMTGDLLKPIRLKNHIELNALGEECADAFFMLVQLSTLAGFDLRDEVAKKYAKNLQRKWKEPDADGVVEHVR